ncbi:Uncharacterized protein Rs2_04884 [Raphanus sativus]|nr:Uncharacterized protein Rs2_04884 [Raphanus sativus]
MAKKNSKSSQTKVKKKSGASPNSDTPPSSSDPHIPVHMFPLNLSLEQGEGPGFLRPEDGHGRGNMFSIGSQFNSQLHRRHISLHKFVLVFENTREYAYYHQKKRYEPAQYVWILSWMVLLIS